MVFINFDTIYFLRDCNFGLNVAMVNSSLKSELKHPIADAT